VPDLYHALKPSFLGVKIGYFANSPAILAYFLAVAGAGLLISRLWCRALCPLGAVYAVASARAPFHRIVDECKRCSLCSRECRTGAIREDMSYARGECVLCMDCVYTCPSRGVRFALSGPDKAAPAPRAKAPGGKGLSRRDFIVLLLSSIAALGFGRKPGVAGGDAPGRGAGVPTGLIRPPAALEEKDFTDRCVRCGNCMKVCITNGLQPTFLEAGYGGIWTPRLIPEIGCCEYRCTLCGDTCPTGAIPKLTLEEKMVTRLGLARIDASICLPYAQGKECLVCEEHCPAAEKAISLDPGPEPGVMRPRVIEELCVGCGACQNKCPVRPVRAIRVSANTAGRTAVGSRNLRAGNGYAR
jgi:ferredoxin